MRVLGLDPGLRHTGWGVIDVAGNRLTPCRRRRRACADRSAAGRTARFAVPRSSIDVLERFRPDEAAVEETFVNKNAASTLRLGVARGVVLLAPAERGVPVAEYSANMIKKSVVGAGHAGKEQVQLMVRRLLPGCAIDEPDAADALAVAICHAHHAGTVRAWQARSATRRPARRGREPGAMIAKLSGTLDSIGPDGAVIDVGGVGYLAFCSTRTLGRLPPPGGAVRLLVETHVREDHIHLYGFIDAAERDWFRLLTTVQGVGARLALAILSAIAPEALTLAIAAQDKAALARADGVGPRLAARIVNELRDKVGALGLAAPPRAGSPAAAPAGAGGVTGAIADAVSALENLNIGRAEAYGAVTAAARRLGDGAAVEALITAGLQELGQGLKRPAP